MDFHEGSSRKVTIPIKQPTSNTSRHKSDLERYAANEGNLGGQEEVKWSVCSGDCFGAEASSDCSEPGFCRLGTQTCRRRSGIAVS
jgi:hypothetical protein